MFDLQDWMKRNLPNAPAPFVQGARVTIRRDSVAAWVNPQTYAAPKA